MKAPISALLVEDDAIFAEYLSTRLREELPELQIDRATNLYDAKRLLQRSTKTPYAVAILDDVLPTTPMDELSSPRIRLDGGQVLVRMFQERSARTHLFHITGFDAIDSNSSIGERSKQAFLKTPVRDWARELVSAIGDVLAGELLMSFGAKPEIVSASQDWMNLLLEREPNPARIRELHSRAFEELIAETWNRLGYDVELTKQTRDGGRDIIAIRQAEAEVRYLIECKRYSAHRKVGVEIVRALYGVKVDERATKGILATTSSFTKDAHEFFSAHRWELEARDLGGVMEWISMAARHSERRADAR